jgi:hypothetical protein
VVGTTDGVASLQFGKMIDLGTTKLTDFIGKQEGYFWTFVIVVTCVMFGIFSPVGGIIAMVVGLIFASLLGIGGAISTTLIILVSVIGVIIGLKVKS